MSEQEEIFPEGTELWVGNGADPEDFTQVKGLLDLGGNLGSETPLVDVSALEDKETQYGAGGRSDGGERQMKFKWLPNDPGQTQLLADAKTKKLRNFELRLPNAMKWPHTLQLAGWSLDGPSAGNPYSMTIKGGLNKSNDIA